MIRLSATLIKDVLSCTMKGYYRLEKPEASIMTPEMALGDVVHKTLELYWDNRDKAISYAYDEAEKRELDCGLAIKHVMSFFNYFQGLCSPEDEVERYFDDVKVYDDVVLVGKLDRVNVETGLVIDWKTTKTPPKDLSNDIQFMLYDYVFQRLYNKEATAVVYASLAKGELIPYKKDAWKFNALMENVIPRVIETLRHRSFSKDGIFDYYSDRFKRSQTCFYCPYLLDCWEYSEEG